MQENRILSFMHSPTNSRPSASQPLRKSLFLTLQAKKQPENTINKKTLTKLIPQHIDSHISKSLLKKYFKNRGFSPYPLKKNHYIFTKESINKFSVHNFLMMKYLEMQKYF